MFIYKPTIKRKSTDVAFEGFYLLLMLPETADLVTSGEEPLRAYVTKLRLHLNPAQNKLEGKLICDGQKYPLNGILGNNGPIVVSAPTYNRGRPIPKILGDIFAQGLVNLYHGDWKEEFAKYGQHINRNASGLCYRCGTAVAGDICKDCTYVLELCLHKEGMKPPPITIKPVGIESEEKVGAGA